jgi:hypothetical protein
MTAAAVQYFIEKRFFYVESRSILGMLRLRKLRYDRGT